MGQFYELYDRIAPTFGTQPIKTEESVSHSQPLTSCSDVVLDEDVEGLLAGLRRSESENVEDVDQLTTNGSIHDSSPRFDSVLEKRCSLENDEEMDSLFESVKRSRLVVEENE